MQLVARVFTSTPMELDMLADQVGGELEEFGDFSEWEGVMEDDGSVEFQSEEVDPELREEMLELLSVFQAVYENRSAIDTQSLLHKCVYMCERIMERYPRLPQVVAMHEQATALLLQLCSTRSHVSSSTESCSASSSAPRSGRNLLMTDVKAALDRVDRDARMNDEFKDPDEGRVVNGVYRHKGIWYCQLHTDQEQCRQCEVDYRLLNQVHRSRTEEEAEGDGIIRKEQERLEELERQRINSRVQAEGPYIHQADAEDFESIAKELNEELARARETDKVRCFSPFFQISEERKLVL